MSAADRDDRGFALLRLRDGWLGGSFGELAALPGVVHLVTTREGPVFGQRAESPRTAEAVRTLTAALGLRATAFCRQVHGNTVLRVTAGGLAGAADALVTASPGLAVLGRSADCPLVLAAARDASGRVVAVGMAHASWRATVAGVTERMLAELLAAGGAATAAAANVVAGIAPSAGPCCYEVGPEVRAAALAGIGPHARAFFAPRGGKFVFDLWAANVDQLARAGVPREAVSVAGLCTLCRNDLFPSHRREGETAGRFAAAIGRL